MRESQLGRAKRAKRAKSRAEWRAAVLDRDQGLCRMYGVDLSELKLSNACEGQLSAHHVLPISRGGKDDLANGLTLCRRHHLDVVHKYPGWATDHGYLLRTPPSTLQKPETCACGHSSADHRDWGRWDAQKCQYGCRASECIA